MPLQVYYFLITTALYLLLAWAIYLVFRIGQFNNAPIALMGVGAYFTAYALREWDWPFGLALIAAVAIGAVIAFLFALALARAPALPMAIATLAPMVIFEVVVRNLSFLGGIAGFFHIPRVEHLLPITLTAVAIIGFLIYRLDHSRLGRAIETAAIEPDVGATLGVDRYWLSVFLQTAGGAMGALAGVFYAPLMSSIRSAHFSFSVLLNIWSFLFVGGCTTMWGPVIFTPILWGLPLILPQQVALWKNVIYGTLLVIVMVVRPEGVITKRVLRSLRVNSRAWLGQLMVLRKIKSGTRR